jgi:SAM-dependent methyltransferase
MSRCVICSNEENQAFYTVREMMFGTKDTFDYFQCSNCGCLQIKSIPENLSKYYPSQYYCPDAFPPNKSKAMRFLRKKQVSQILFGNRAISKIVCVLTPDSSRVFKERGLLDEIRLNKRIRVLDIGCGSGGLLYLLAEGGIRNSLGIDAYIDSDITYDNGVTIKKGTLTQAKGQYDLVMFQHSFEHIYDQSQMLHDVYSLLSSGGICLINTPTVSSFAWNFFKTDWVQLDAPRHLCIHSLNSINFLAEKTGFKIKNIVYNSGSFQFWGSLQYQRGIGLKEKLVFSKSEMKVFDRRAKELNKNRQGDQAIFYLQKG